jgi:hypothetical protein
MPVAYRQRWGHRWPLIALVTLLAGSGCRGATEPASEDFGAAFDRMWSEFDVTYPYFEFKGIDWDAIRAAWRDEAAASPDLTTFLGVIRQVLAPLRDVHVVLESPNGARSPTYTSTAFVNWDRDAWLASIAGAGWVQAAPNLGSGRMDGVAYMAIGSWNSQQFMVAQVDQILEQFRNEPSLIIDVRPNGGGNDQLALAVAERFTTQPFVGAWVRYRSGPDHDDLGPLQPRNLTPRGAWQFSGQVIVLAGRGCASSNEHFISAMRELPNVTIVGDTTAGATANPAPFALTAGWKVWISRWMAYTADQKIIEWNGIPPDVVVPATAEDFAAGRDPVLEYALQALTTGGPAHQSSRPASAPAPRQRAAGTSRLRAQLRSSS